jgi:hypothetical protein
VIESKSRKIEQFQEDLLKIEKAIKRREDRCTKIDGEI